MSDWKAQERADLRARVAELEAENEAYRIREELGLNTSDLLTRATQAESDARRLAGILTAVERVAQQMRPDPGCPVPKACATCQAKDVLGASLRAALAGKEES